MSNRFRDKILFFKADDAGVLSHGKKENAEKRNFSRKMWIACSRVKYSGKGGKARQELTGVRETALPCKPYPMQRLLVLRISTSARRIRSNDGLSSSATMSVDKLPRTTEPGLSVWSEKEGASAPSFLLFRIRYPFVRGYPCHTGAYAGASP